MQLQVSYLLYSIVSILFNSTTLNCIHPRFLSWRLIKLWKYSKSPRFYNILLICYQDNLFKPRPFFDENPQKIKSHKSKTNKGTSLKFWIFTCLKVIIGMASSSQISAWIDMHGITLLQSSINSKIVKYIFAKWKTF